MEREGDTKEIRINGPSRKVSRVTVLRSMWWQPG